MTSAYFAPLVLLPTIITKPGVYETRAGEKVQILVCRRDGFGCFGIYSSGIHERFHQSGRIFATSESTNDIVKLFET